MPEVLITSIVSFISTNLDDIFVLMVLYIQAAGRRDRSRILAGRYLGTALLLAASTAGALGTRLLPEGAIRYLGVFPILLGVKSFLGSRKEKETAETEPTAGSSRQKRIGISETAFLTISCGADNIGVYIPIFSRYSAVELAVTAAIFAGMTALWCLAGYRLAGQTFIKERVRKYQDILVPVIFVLLGVWILMGF